MIYVTNPPIEKFKSGVAVYVTQPPIQRDGRIIYVSAFAGVVL